MNEQLKLALIREARDGRPAWRVAADCGLTPTVLSAIVMGRRGARPEEREALARVLGRSEADLFGDSDRKAA